MESKAPGAFVGTEAEPLNCTFGHSIYKVMPARTVKKNASFIEEQS